MKHFIVFMISAFWLGVAGFAFAQNKTNGPIVSPKPTPTNGPLLKRPVKFGASRFGTLSNLHAIGVRIRQQKMQLEKDLKAGKITQEQAKTKWENLKTLSKQKMQYFHQNGQKDLTPDQKNQLDQALN